MQKILIKQAWIAPLAMGGIVLFSLFVPGHNSLSQHMSELANGPAWAAMIDKILSVVAGFSLLVFAFGTALLRGWFTALNTAFFGAAMIASGLVPMGSPLHGLYGLALFSVLVPACFAGEFLNTADNRNLIGYSLATSTLGLGYMWALLLGFDPAGFEGLTQRIATMIAFCWFAVIALSWEHIQRKHR